MKTSVTLAFILASLVFIAEINARPGHSKSSLSDEDLQTESDFAEIHRHSGTGRRARHSRQIHPGYYSQPYSESYESRILLSLEEINMRLKLISEQLSYKPFSYPPFIPYPYPVPFKMGNDSFPNIGTRFSGPVWGMVNTGSQTPADDEDEGSRPISFKPSKQNLPQGVRTPPVEHGSIQAEKSPTTQKPVTTTKLAKIREPTTCESAILNCCRFEDSERKNCFEQLQCSKTYATGKACLPEVINMVIKVFTSAYMPR